MAKTDITDLDVAMRRLRQYGWRPLPDEVVRNATQRYIAQGEVERLAKEEAEIARKDRQWQDWDIYNKKPLPPIEEERARIALMKRADEAGHAR